MTKLAQMLEWRREEKLRRYYTIRPYYRRQGRMQFHAPFIPHRAIYLRMSRRII